MSAGEAILAAVGSIRENAEPGRGLRVTTALAIIWNLLGHE
jgi:hypothetical protein